MKSRKFFAVAKKFKELRLYTQFEREKPQQVPQVMPNTGKKALKNKIKLDEAMKRNLRLFSWKRKTN